MRLLKMALIPIIIAMLQVPAADGSAINHEVTRLLAEYTASEVPGLQYIVVDAEGILFEFAGGLADIQNQKTMTLDTTLMAYSMTKTYTAIAILQLAEQGKIRLDDPIDRHLPNHLYGGHGITIRHLLAHTSGLPNPIPLRWVHLAEQSAGFDEDAALAQVVAENPKLSFEPGRKYAYSNIGYWLLGKIVERVSGQSYTDYVRTNIIRPLGLSSQEMDFVIPDPARHANGYLAKYSLMNLMKGFVTDSKFWGEYEGKWLRLRSHHLNGPAFGGLVGTARSFVRLLQDQLRTKSVLLSPETKRLLETQQTDGRGKKIPMTLGWHVGDLNGTVYFFKEGGGGGFHSEMRLYPDAARVITLCAVSDKTLSPEVKAKFIKHSEELYRKAEEVEPNKHHVYGSWATAYYWRGQYAEAWSMVAKERASGGKPSEKFLGLLREKMPEPATKQTRITRH